MSDTKSPEVNGDLLKSGQIDLNALADAFEAQGNKVEAKRYRELALRQPELEKRRIAELTELNDKRQQERMQNQRDIKPLQPHQRVDAFQVPREEFEQKIRKKVENMLQVKSNPQALK